MMKMLKVDSLAESDLVENGKGLCSISQKCCDPLNDNAEAQPAECNPFFDTPLDMTVHGDGDFNNLLNPTGIFDGAKGVSKVDNSFNFDNQINFPFVNIQSVPINDSQLKEGLQYICYITNNGSIENDSPEFIDINDLSYKDFRREAPTQSQVPIQKANTLDDPIKISTDEDDDVVFVAKYSTEPTAKIDNVDNEKVKRKRRRKKAIAVPRRNPKRVAQMEKASVDLAMKLSIPARIFNAKITKTDSKFDNVKYCRQSCRNTGAVLRPPSPLTNKDWKDWPSDIHEIPVYDPNKKVPSPRKFCTSSKKSQKPQYEEEKTFAQLTHETLHSVLCYVTYVCQHNKIVKETGVGEEEIREDSTGGGRNAFKNILNVLGDDCSKRNVNDACDILLDTCKLYCLANDVSEEGLVSYISNLEVEDVRAFLDKDNQT